MKTEEIKEEESCSVIIFKQLDSESSHEIECIRPKRERKQKLDFKFEASTYEFEKKTISRKKKRFSCLKCSNHKTFLSRKQLNKHNKNVHINKSEENIICEICSASLCSEAYYNRHVKTKHPTTPKLFICDYDGKDFAHKDYLRIHMDRHRVHQILTCKICTKSYISRHTFRRHLKMVGLLSLL